MCLHVKLKSLLFLWIFYDLTLHQEEFCVEMEYVLWSLLQKIPNVSNFKYIFTLIHLFVFASETNSLFRHHRQTSYDKRLIQQAYCKKKSLPFKQCFIYIYKCFTNGILRRFFSAVSSLSFCFKLNSAIILVWFDLILHLNLF